MSTDGGGDSRDGTPQGWPDEAIFIWARNRYRVPWLTAFLRVWL